jgi:heparosan-N-sulfate-glucuronate 5-epimerase
MEYNPNTQVKAIPLVNNAIGSYYLDLTDTLIDYTSGHYGCFDSKGIPMIGKGESAYYNAIVVLQYGFIVHELFLRNIDIEKNKNILSEILVWLDKSKDTIGDCFVWRNLESNKKYNLKPGFISAMTQGEAISFYVRMYELFKNETYLEYAKKAYNFLQIDFENGGVKRIDELGCLWFEEYPSPTPSYVLNGFIYTVFGIYDLYKITLDPSIKALFDSTIVTLKKNLHKYDVGYWSLYDQYTQELVMVYYQKNVHIPQMEALYYITGDSLFLEYKTKWEKTLTPLNIFRVKIMYRVRYRSRWLLNLIKK